MKSRGQFFRFVSALLEEEYEKTLQFDELIRTAGASAPTAARSFYVVSIMYSNTLLYNSIEISVTSVAAISYGSFQCNINIKTLKYP